MRALARRIALVAAVALVGHATPARAEARSKSTNVAGTITAIARLDISITIPRMLFLRVGSGTDLSNVGTADLVDVTVPGVSIFSGAAAAATGGDLGGGAVTVRVQGNGGDITLNSATTGPLLNASGTQQIGWNQIVATSAPLAIPTANFSNIGVPHPTFNTGPSGGAGSAVLLSATNRMVRQEGKWTFNYANTVSAAIGTYGGAGINNSRVTYTATMP